MATNKTQENDGDVDAFIASVESDIRRRDSETVLKTMTKISGEEPRMWGSSIVGFGSYTYKPKAGGAENKWFKVGFSPRKQSLTLYIMDGFSTYDGLLTKLGKHSTGKSCLYIKKLEDVDNDVLEELISQSIVSVERRIANTD
jgi:hypothetical protein